MIIDNYMKQFSVRSNIVRLIDSNILKERIDRVKKYDSRYLEMIEENSSVLDIGCGDGVLLKELVDTKNVNGLGIEIDQNSVIKSLEKGLQVIQCNIDDGLQEFSADQWDYVILNQTLQSTRKPDFVMEFTK